MGGKSAAKKQAAAQQEAIDVQRQAMQDYYSRTDPYSDFYKQFMPALAGSLQPLDRGGLLTEYYKGPEYAAMSDQARREQLTASGAGGMGGYGSTTTGNALASIAPMLGQQYLGQREQQQLNQITQLMGLVGSGANVAAGQGSAGMQNAGTLGGLYQGMGQIKAGASQAPMQGAMSGAAAGGMIGGPMGALVGGGLGLLGGLF